MHYFRFVDVDIKMGHLRKLHFVAFIIHSINLLAILGLAVNSGTIDTGIATYTSAISNMTAGDYVLTYSKSGNSVYPLRLIVGFFAVTALFHFMYCLDIRSWYSAQLQNGLVWARWLEYGITATLMQVIFASYSGVVLESELAAIITLTICMMTYGAWSETLDSNMASIVYSLGLIPWIATLFMTLSGLFNAESPPAWVYALVIIIQIVLFGCFGVVRLLSIIYNEPIPRHKSEIAYITLSFVSKTLLGWIVAGKL